MEYYILLSIVSGHTKKFQLSMGAEIWGLERSKFEKRQIYGFLKNGPQGPQKMVKMNSDGFPSHFGPQ